MDVLVPRAKAREHYLIEENILLNVVFRVSSEVPNQEGTFYSGHWDFLFVFFSFLAAKKKKLAALCGIWDVSSPDQGVTPAPPALEGQSLNHCTTRRPQDFTWNLTNSVTWTLFPLP